MAHVLIAETNVDHYGDSDRKTGIWLEEITSFYDVVTAAGHEVVLASPKGGAVPIDPASMDADKRTLEILADPAFHKAAIEDTKKLSDLAAEDFDAIYLGGGHGALWDFPNDLDLKRLAEGIWNRGGYITSVCHGEAGMLELRDQDGEYLVKGRKINGFTDEEERMNGTAETVPHLSETELKKRGADFVEGAPYTEFAVEDDRFITGQNPFSSTKVAQLLVAALAR